MEVWPFLVAALVLALYAGACARARRPPPCALGPAPAPRLRPASRPAKHPAKHPAAEEDRMGPHGPEVAREGLRTLSVPDHEPLEN